ncbi:acyl-CoA dehydratase activase [Enterococcus faecalis]
MVRKQLAPTSGDSKKAASKIVAKLAPASETYMVATGYGRNLLAADKAVTEITCHARGASVLKSGLQTVIDIGSQDSKTIKLDQNGKVLNFNMNDKCAAGTGRFVEALMRTLGENITHLDSFVAEATPIKINSMCIVFAESEVIGLIGKGAKRADIALGVLHSIARRISNQVRQVTPIAGPIFFSGGLSNSRIMAELIEEYTSRLSTPIRNLLSMSVQLVLLKLV